MSGIKAVWLESVEGLGMESVPRTRENLHAHAAFTDGALVLSSVGFSVSLHPSGDVVWQEGTHRRRAEMDECEHGRLTETGVVSLTMRGSNIEGAVTLMLFGVDAATLDAYVDAWETHRHGWEGTP